MFCFYLFLFMFIFIYLCFCFFHGICPTVGETEAVRMQFSKCCQAGEKRALRI